MDNKTEVVTEKINKILEAEQVDLSVQPYFEHVGNGAFVIKVNQFIVPKETPEDGHEQTEQVPGKNADDKPAPKEAE